MRIRRHHFPKRVVFAILLPFALLMLGTVGYMMIEKWRFFDALYMSAITLTTVGYGEIPDPLSPGGRVFTICFLFGGVFTLFYTATETIRGIVSGEFRSIYGKAYMESTLARMKNHIVVIGYGRMGRPICQEFERQKIPYVVVDRDDRRLRDLKMESGVPIQGDATLDEILKLAGVERARSLICVLPSDSDNLYITLSARVLNEKLFIIARAEGEGAEEKLKRVGANRIFAPYVLTGHRVVQTVLRPTVGHVIEKALHPNVEDYQIEELHIEAKSPLCGKSLKESNLHEEYGIVVLIVKKPSGQLLYNPKGDVIFEADCVVVVVGDKYEVAKLAHQAKCPSE